MGEAPLVLLCPQVTPTEIEQVIMKHPAVRDVCVVGVPHSDTGETPQAWVILKEGVTATGEDIKQLVQGETKLQKILDSKFWKSYTCIFLITKDLGHFWLDYIRIMH